jgi:hypothetical protein
MGLSQRRKIRRDVGSGLARTGQHLVFAGIFSTARRGLFWNEARNCPSNIVTLLAQNSNPRDFPVRHGSLCVSAQSFPKGASNDLYAAVVDNAAELSVVLLSVRGGGERASVVGSEALARCKDALQLRLPMYEIVSTLRSLSANERPCHIGAAVLRFSQPEARVEILNAGMPAITCVLPDGELSFHHALSAGIGERFGEVHPYELAPLTWGSSWLVVSDPVTEGKRAPNELRALWQAAELAVRGPELGQNAESLAETVVLLLGQAESARAGTLLGVHADPTRRFRSGIRP